MPEFKIKVSADTQEFGSRINGVVQQLNSGLVNSFTERFAGLFGLEKLNEWARQTLEYAQQFNTAGKKLGVGTEFLQEAAFAAKSTGASFEEVGIALRRMQIAQAD